MPYEEDTVLFIGLIFVFGRLQPHRKAMLQGDWGRCHQQAKSHLSDKCIARITPYSCFVFVLRITTVLMIHPIPIIDSKVKRS